jgi:hypothetical protein
MSRKYYKTIAEAFRKTKPFDNSNFTLTQWKTDVNKVMFSLQDFNSLFDGDKFKKACGYWENEK